jgi:adenine phosphoribosyltransferase
MATNNKQADKPVAADGKWPPYWNVGFGADMPAYALPLVVSSGGFGIYSFNMMGQAKINNICAHILKDKISSLDARFDVFITAEAKAIGLTEELARLFGHDEYVVLRKSRKLYMNDPVELAVKSITTPEPQKFYLGREHYELLKNKRVIAIDDVISTGGTMRAFFEMSRQIGFSIAAVAVVLTEETRWTEYEDTPVLSIDHIPLPDQI